MWPGVKAAPGARRAAGRPALRPPSCSGTGGVPRGMVARESAGRAVLWALLGCVCPPPPFGDSIHRSGAFPRSTGVFVVGAASWTHAGNRRRQALAGAGRRAPRLHVACGLERLVPCCKHRPPGVVSTEPAVGPGWRASLPRVSSLPCSSWNWQHNGCLCQGCVGQLCWPF